MSEESLRRHLEALRRELASAKRLDGETRARLDRLADEIEGALGAEEPDFGSLNERVAAAAVRFEAEHPRFARVLSDVTDTLAKLGL
jgi:hypothetical protein